MYIGPRIGTFTEQGSYTGQDYTICPNVLIPVHPEDVGVFQKRPREFNIVW